MNLNEVSIFEFKNMVDMKLFLNSKIQIVIDAFFEFK
jgi:hypothetical protein